jgi:hypothetical protein
MVCERQIRGAGARARNGVACARWGVKVLSENHVDTSSVQQTLVTMDSFKVSVLVRLGRDLERDARLLV